jgi:hypothetical protein
MIADPPLDGGQVTTLTEFGSPRGKKLGGEPRSVGTTQTQVTPYREEKQQ